MFKVFGVLLLSAIPMFYGIHKSRQLCLQKKNLDGLLYLVRECRQGIAYQQLPIRDLITGLPSKQYPILEHLILNIKEKDPLSAWEIISEQENTSVKLVMDDFFRALGTSDRESQLQICDIAAKRLEQIQLSSREETAVKIKLYRTVGMLAGAFIAIIFI